jgi:hypothetical protein
MPRDRSVTRAGFLLFLVAGSAGACGEPSDGKVIMPTSSNRIFDELGPVW